MDVFRERETARVPAASVPSAGLPRSSIIRAATLDCGVQGSQGRFSYVATWTNGAGVNTRDANDGKSFSGRAAVEVADNVSLGGFVGLHDYDDATGATEYGTAFGADLDWGGWSGGWHLQAAFVTGDNWKALDASGNAAQFLTGQAVLSYFIPVGFGSVGGDRAAGPSQLGRPGWRYRRRRGLARNARSVVLRVRP